MQTGDSDFGKTALISEVTEIPVPMVLISGAQDLNTPMELAADWFEQVAAPLGKRHFVFEASGHAPFLTEPARFADTMREIARNSRDGS